MRPAQLWRCLLLIGLCLISRTALASGLQVSPVTLSLQPSQVADGLWLSNVSDTPLFAQVRVYHWVQNAAGVQELIPSRGLVISPPLLQIAADSKQFVRVIRVAPPPIGPDAVEDSYRLAIDELPVSLAGGTRGLHFVLHYSLPIFVEPADGRTVTPRLQWSLDQNGGRLLLQVRNVGTGHAQLAAVSLISGGHRRDITNGLLGYVLPGATMQFATARAAASLGDRVTVEAMVNGSTVTQNVSLADDTQ
jgi:fimbrial chaperone protein